MARILGVGIATLDIINTVAHYPVEDEEMRALSQRKVRGGNVTNTLCVLSQLGHLCHWAGTLVDEPDAKTICDDLVKYNIDYSLTQQVTNGKVPTSYITLNQQNGSRTIVHFRDLEEPRFEDLKQIDFSTFDWIHFEGRNIDETLATLKWLKQLDLNIPVSLEIEKKRENISCLFPYADLLLFSRHFALQHDFSSVDTLFQFARDHGADCPCICTWGDEGAYLSIGTQLDKFDAQLVSKPVDTIGAGDTFNAGIIHARVNMQSWQQSVEFANRLAARKIRQHGFENLRDA